MKFLHTADLHLDSAFCQSSTSAAAAKRERQREVLKNIFSLATSELCDMVLISGDLFDSVHGVTPETTELCLKLFKDFGKPIVISPGNHDPYVNGSFYRSVQIPANVYIFSSNELQFFDFYDLDVTVAGYAFTSSAMPENPLSAPLPVRHNQNTFLLCAHADVDIPTSRYAPILSSTLSKHGFDYCALGHVHKYTEISDNIVYCGFPEGRSFDELGAGSVMLVTINGTAAPVVQRRHLSKYSYEWQELSLDCMMTLDEIFNALNLSIFHYKDTSGVNLRLELVGVVSEELTDVVSLISAQKYDFLASLEIVNSTLCLPDKDALEHDSTLRGEFYRSLCPLLYSDDAAQRETAIKALSIGLAAIDGKDFLG